MTRKQILFLLVAVPLLPLLYASCDGGGRWTAEWEESFESFQPSEKIMDRIGVEPGMVVAEIGAGNGRFAVKVAERVGAEGLVYANDIDPEAVSFMAERCEREGIDNMVVILSGEVEPRFPKKEMDLVYLINTYDHLSEPIALLKNTVPSLKPSGRLAIIATDAAKLEDHKGHATPREQVIRQVTSAGYKLVSLDISLLYDNIYIFRLEGAEAKASEGGQE
jgi:ubiquinone/menaquinone biosynthesis C-methylase UbiE